MHLFFKYVANYKSKNKSKLKNSNTLVFFKINVTQLKKKHWKCVRQMQSVLELLKILSQIMRCKIFNGFSKANFAVSILKKAT